MPEDKIYCGNCKAELSPSARACPSCGCDPKKAVNYCPNCGEAKVNPNAIICTKCGASLTGGPVKAAPAAASKIFCGNCKEELSAAAHACPKCGSDPRKAVNYCTNCGEKKASETAIICTKCGASLKGGSSRISGAGSGIEWSPELAALVSLVWGAGLYFIMPEEKKSKALLVIVGLIVADIVLVGLSFICAITVLLIVCSCVFFILIVALHIAAAVVTYNEAIMMKGEKPLFEWSIMKYL